MNTSKHQWFLWHETWKPEKPEKKSDSLEKKVVHWKKKVIHWKKIGDPLETSWRLWINSESGVTRSKHLEMWMIILNEFMIAARGKSKHVVFGKDLESNWSLKIQPLQILQKRISFDLLETERFPFPIPAESFPWIMNWFLRKNYTDNQ